MLRQRHGGINPDAAIVVETTTAADVFDVPPEKEVCRLNHGVVVSFMDLHTMYDRDLYAKALQIAQENQIACQVKQAVAGGNNAGAVHQTRDGVRTLALSVPCRYLHSAVCVVDDRDIMSAAELTQAMATVLASGQ